MHTISQSVKVTCWMILTIGHFGKGKLQRKLKYQWLSESLVGGREGTDQRSMGIIRVMK